MINTRSYTFTVNHPEQISNVQKLLNRDYPNGSDTHWAYIIHDKDTNEITGELIQPHLHTVIIYKTPRKSTTLSNYFNIPEHMFCQIYNRKGILEYLTHKNERSKVNYKTDEVVSNFNWQIELNDEIDVLAEFRDFKKLRKGEITAEEFLMSYNIPCQKMTFYNRLRTYTTIVNEEARGGLSPCRE